MNSPIDARRCGPPLELSGAELDHLAEVTSDAYSRKRYADWRSCVIVLAARGHSYFEIETILRSVWMRWAADRAEGTGFATTADLEHFLDTPACSRERLDEMLNETPSDRFS